MAEKKLQTCRRSWQKKHLESALAVARKEDEETLVQTKQEVQQFSQEAAMAFGDLELEK